MRQCKTVSEQESIYKHTSEREHQKAGVQVCVFAMDCREGTVTAVEHIALSALCVQLLKAWVKDLLKDERKLEVVTKRAAAERVKLLEEQSKSSSTNKCLVALQTELKMCQVISPDFGYRLLRLYHRAARWCSLSLYLCVISMSTCLSSLYLLCIVISTAR